MRVEQPLAGQVATYRDKLHPGLIVLHELPLDQAPEGYQRFGDREDGWTKVILHP